MQKTQETKKDGTPFTKYVMEDGDVVTSRFAKVSVKDSAFVNKEGKAIPIKNRFLGVTFEDGSEGVITIKEGQYKVLRKTEDLTGKKIKFENYEHKDYGTLLGARVIEDKKE